MAGGDFENLLRMPAPPDKKTPRTNHFNRLYYTISAIEEVRVDRERHEKRVYRIAPFDEESFAGGEGLRADESARPLAERSRNLRAKAEDIDSLHVRQRPAVRQGQRGKTQEFAAKVAQGPSSAARHIRRGPF